MDQKENQKLDFKIWWDDKNDIGKAYITSLKDENAAKQFHKEGKALLDGHKNAKLIFDLAKSEIPVSRSVRKHLTKAADHPNLKKVAFLGGAAIYKVLAKFVLIGAGKKDKIGFFNTEKECLQWLKKDNQ